MREKIIGKICRGGFLHLGQYHGSMNVIVNPQTIYVQSFRKYWAFTPPRDFEAEVAHGRV